MIKQDTANPPGATAGRGMSQQFEFINLLNRPGLTDVGTKKAVRAHAMRDFRRRRGGSNDHGRSQETSSINIATPKPSPKVQLGRNSIAHDPSPWTTVSKRPAGTSVPLANAGYSLEDLEWLISHGSDAGVLMPESGFVSEIAFDGSNSINGRDEFDMANSSERPRKRKKLGDHVACPITSCHDGDCRHESSECLIGSEMTLLSPRLIKTPGDGSPDPFDVLPITCTKRVHILVHHYNSVFVRPGSQMVPRTTWINEALNDSALFQATLLPSAAHYALFYNLDLTESFHLFDQTTRLVYKRLGDPKHGTSDATLAAVICLSFVENVLGNSSASSVHVDGLKRMVDLRGGLHALGFKGVLQRMVLWADNWTGILALSPPRFPLQKPTKATTSYSATDPNMSKLKNALEDEDIEASLVTVNSSENQDNVFGIILGLQQLSTTLAAIHANKTTVTEALQFNERVFLLERQLLLSLVSSDEPKGHQQASSQDHPTIPLEHFIRRSFSHAAYIFIYSTLHSTLRDLPLQSPFFGTFVQRLHTALNQNPGGFFHVWRSTSPVMLLWVLVVGAVAAYRRPERPWLMEQLTSVCLLLKIHDLAKLRELLEEMMWVEGALDAALKTLWAEVQKGIGLSLSEVAS